MRCLTYFVGWQCPQCEYKYTGDAPWRRKYFPSGAAQSQQPGDSEVRIIQPPYRATDPCE